MARCVLIVDSLKTGRLPDGMRGLAAQRHLHWLGGRQLIEVVILEIADDDVAGLAALLMDELKPQGYYAHFQKEHELIVVFPGQVHHLCKGDSHRASQLRQFGTRFGIPAEQMPFEHLFESDHPNRTGSAPESLDRIGYFRPTASARTLGDRCQGEEVRFGARVRESTPAPGGHRLVVLSDGVEMIANLPGSISPEPGDIIGVAGRAICRDGQLTMDVERWTVLTPALPGVFSSEPASRERAILTDPSLRRNLDLRCRLLETIRDFFRQREFTEVETPILLPVRDIAPVQHFQVSPRLAGHSVLRICPENHLKRLIVAGFDRVYEIARNFRVERPGTDRQCEFTMLECYQAYANWEDMFELATSLVRQLLPLAPGGSIELAGKTIDTTAPWRRVDFVEEVRALTGIDLAEPEDLASLLRRMTEAGFETDGLASRRECINRLGERVEATLVAPTFLVHHPFETICVAKRSARPGLANRIERFELFMGGLEIAHAFTELSDPMEQRSRMEALMCEKVQSGQLEHEYDEPFLRALELGLPPTGGLGIGIDRLMMVLTGDPIQRVIGFPENIDDREEQTL